MEITGKFISGTYVGIEGHQVTIELTIRELLEQLTHKQIGELLEMINLPEPKKEIEALKFPDYADLTGYQQQIYDKINEIINFINRKE